MKRVFPCFMSVVLIMMCLFGCSSTDSSMNSTKDEAQVELVVFAAASMTETLTEIADMYKDVQPNVDLTFNFDSSGTLKTQIEEGAVCDLFIAASQKPMNNLDGVLENTRVDILENKVALVVPEDNPKSIESFDSLVDLLKSGDILMAIGNADVPVGEYTLKIFDYYGLSEEELNNNGCLTYGSNVKEVTTQVQEGLVDCGIVYQTDAYSASLDVVDTATKDMCGQVIYPAAVLEKSQNIDEAKEFLDFLKIKEASTVFERVGFTPLFK